MSVGDFTGSAAEIAETLVGQRLVAADKRGDRIILTTERGAVYALAGTSGCCYNVRLGDFLERVGSIDHAITAVKVTSDVTHLTILAGMEEVVGVDFAGRKESDAYVLGFELQVVHQGL